MLLKPINLLVWVLGVCLLAPSAGLAAERSVSIPLEDGWLSTSQLRTVLEKDFYLPPAVLEPVLSPDVGLNVESIGGWVVVDAMNRALGQGFHLRVSDQALTIEYDPQKLPRGWNESCDALRRFTQVMAPDATARQERTFGLHLPRAVDVNKPLVILVHGLDGDSGCCADLAGLLKADGFQTAMFAYPAEQPLEESAQLLSQHLRALHEVYPGLKIELVTESMGGLVARRYVESSEYVGGVDRLIMIAPPNGGSRWTGGAVVLKLMVNAFQWKHDSDWSPAWLITEGLCQAASDLRPQSEFLCELNAQPRRSGVRYTIIAGDQPITRRYERNLLALADGAIDAEYSDVWGLRQIKRAIESQSLRLMAKSGASDGPVTVASARLPGVNDFVVVHADHIALYESVGGKSPAAYAVIRDRLKN
jgi:hypothetical protein